MYAIDASSKAIVVAKRNAVFNQADVLFIEGNILKPGSEFGNAEIVFDIIVSNPPYIRKGEMKAMSKRVSMMEPAEALFVDDEDPLLFYHAISDFSKRFLKKDGTLYFEINESMGKEAEKLLGEKGFKEIVLKKDMSDKDRMVMARR
jgi:release factor glutamine methyltransferase